MKQVPSWVWAGQSSTETKRRQSLLRPVSSPTRCSGQGLGELDITSAEGAREWVRAVKKRGAKGIKLRGGTREALAAIYDEAQTLGLGTMVITIRMASIT